MNTYVLAASIVLGTAVAVAAYHHTIDQDMEKTKKLFAQIVVAGAIVSYIAIYLSSQKKQRTPIAEPFGLEPVGATMPSAVSSGRSVPMPST